MEPSPISNKARILRFIYEEKEGTSKNEIAKQLGLSMPTVFQHIKSLQQAKLIQEGGQYASTGGRKASVMQGIPWVRLAAGLEISRDSVAMVIIDLFCDVLATRHFDLPFSADNGYCVALRQAFDSFLQEAGVEQSALLGLGITLPGIVNTAENLVKFSTLLNLRDMPLDMIQSQFDLPCAFLKSAEAEGMAEIRRFSAEASLFFLSLGPVVGGSFFDGGRLYTGDHGRASLVGHMTLIPEGRPCYCGKKGCVAAYCSSTLLSEFVAGPIDSFFERLRAGEKRVQDRWDEYLGHLAIMINNLRALYDCDILLGGYVGGRIGSDLPRLREMAGALDRYEGHGAYIHVSRYANRATASGAAIQMIDRFLDNEDERYY